MDIYRMWKSTSTIRSVFAHGVLVSIISVSSFVRAEEGTPGPDEKPTGQSADKPVPDQPAKEKSLLDKLSDELLKEIDDTPGFESGKPKDGADKMDRAVKGMRSAGDKLDEGMTADETQKIQKQVIQDLEDIINQLENPPPSQGGGEGGGGSNGGRSGRSSRGGGGSSLRRSSMQRGGQQGTAAGQAQKQAGIADEQRGGTTSENATDSSKQSQSDRKAAEEAARRRKLEMDIWGHLPPHVREELLNTYGERMLPKYEHLVKQFYEALSTQGDTKKK